MLGKIFSCMNRLLSRRLRYRNSLVQGSGGAAAAVIALLVIVLILLRLLAPGVWYRLTSPIWSFGASLSAHVAGTTESKATLRTERDTYQEKATALSVQNAALSAQVADLTKLLGSRTAPTPGIVASVLARPPVAPYDILVIDQGTSAGVSLGALVTGNGGTPVGTIGEADANHSRVTLYSTRSIATSGWIGDARIPVTLTGEGAGAFSASVPKIAGVEVGAGVYLASAGAFPIGTVVKIETDPSSPTVSLDVRPYVNPFSLTWVTVERR